MLAMSPRAQELLAARARRRSLIRNRVVAAVLATFVLAWGAVVWDGSMGEPTTTAQATSTTTTTPDDSTSTPGTLTTRQS